MSTPQLQEISLRDPQDEGTALAESVTEVPAGFRPLSHRLVVFIHGYNNTHAVASESYALFQDLLKAAGFISPSLNGEICTVHWPGNKQLGPLAFIAYPAEIKPAINSGQMLAEYLANIPGPQDEPLEIFLVCHSLGNRVGLELLEHLTRLPHPPRNRFAGFCLMAAAVPVKHVELGGPLAAGARYCARTRVLHSRGDDVLLWAFPAGQAAAGDGMFPEAIGRWGQPLHLWHEVRDLTPYDHSDYWRGGSEKPSDRDSRSANEVAQFLGVPVSKELPMGVDTLARRMTDANEIPRRKTPVHRIRGRRL